MLTTPLNVAKFVPEASVMTARWMSPLVSVGNVVPKVTLLVELLKVWLLLSRSTEPPLSVRLA